MPKTIVDTELVKVQQAENGEYQMFIRMSQGGVIEHEPFPGDLQGLVAALQLSAEICAGKFYPRRVVTEHRSGTKQAALTVEPYRLNQGAKQ